MNILIYKKNLFWAVFYFINDDSWGHSARGSRQASPSRSPFLEVTLGSGSDIPASVSSTISSPTITPEMNVLQQDTGYH